jgi:two-component system, OmpR family, phosphate regulon response regulator PhoB
MKPRLLLVEDDSALSELLRYTLEREGYDVVHSADGEEAVFRSREQSFDIAILDWMVPGLSGIEVCRQLRRQASTSGMPIIMLTARTDEPDRIRGLETGADDYITKPFSPRELVARIKAIMRRVRPALAGGSLSYAGIEMDTASHKVLRDSKPLQMGPTEFRLLRHFLEHPGRVFSREQLLDAVWGHDVYVELRTVDVHIRRLRKAVNLEGCADIIRTVRSAGYSLDTDASAVAA